MFDTNVSDRGGQSLFVHSFYAIADIGNGKELLKLYVEELNSPNSDNDIQRTYMLQNIEKKQLGLTSSQNKSASSIAQTASIKNVADLFAVVKAKDKQFNPGKEVNTKLLNADGTPRIFYHGTANDFDVFNMNEGAYGKGAYFTTSTAEAADYAIAALEAAGIEVPTDYDDIEDWLFENGYIILTRMILRKN